MIPAPFLVHAAHFPEPSPTPYICDFMGSIHIKGIHASPGDEIAFFDTLGVLCGRYIIKENGLYGIIHVYGDHPDTLQDEGAENDETLHVRIWDASDQLELGGIDIQLIGGYARPGSSFEPSPIPPVWKQDHGYILNIDTETYFSRPIPTPLVCNYLGNITIRGIPADKGDEIAVFDSNGILCGHTRVLETGQYGVIQIYGDDPNTKDIDEGANENEPLHFDIWDISHHVLIDQDHIITQPGAAMGSFVASQDPPIFQNNGGFILDLAGDYACQSVMLTPKAFAQSAGSQMIINAIYDVSDFNTRLSTLSVNFHFDTNRLLFQGFQQVFDMALTTQDPDPITDTLDLDHNPETTHYVSLSWDGSEWPGQSLPISLAHLSFMVRMNALPGVTNIGVSFSKTSDGYIGGSSRVMAIIDNSPASCYGTITYNGTQIGHDYILVWGAEALQSKQDITQLPPLFIMPVSGIKYQINILSGNYIMAIYRDVDGQGDSFHSDVDPNEPFGFYTNSSLPDSQNIPPVAISLNANDMKSIDLFMFDLPYVRSFQIGRHVFPHSFPSIFPNNQALWIDCIPGYYPGNHMISNVLVSGPGLNQPVLLLDSGYLPDAYRQDGQYTAWIPIVGSVQNGVYQIHVIADILERSLSKTLEGIALPLPEIVSPKAVISKQPEIKWEPIYHAAGYDLFLTDTPDPKTLTDFVLIQTDLTQTTYPISTDVIEPSHGKTYYYYVSAWDQSRMNVSYSQFSSFLFDLTPPGIQNVIFDPSGPVTAGPLSLTIIFTEPMTIEKPLSVHFGMPMQIISGTYTSNITWHATLMIPKGLNGKQTLTISQGFDLADNQMKSNTMYSFFADATPPVVSNIQLSPKSPIPEGRSTLTIQFSENMMTQVEPVVQMGNPLKNIVGTYITNSIWQGSFQMFMGDDGTYSIYISKAKDILGNEMAMNSDFQFIVDTQAPSTPTQLTGTQSDVDYTVSLSWKKGTELDIAGYNIYRDGIKRNVNLLSSVEYSDPIKSGKTYSYNVTVVDHAGHESPFSLPFSITTQSNAPIITRPETGALFRESKIAVAGIAEPGAIVYLFKNGLYETKAITSSAGTFSIPHVPLDEGENTLQAYVEISAGLSSPPSNTVQVSLFPKPPAPINIVGTPGDTQITLHWDASTYPLFKGYYVYRGTNRLTNEPIIETQFIDKYLTNGKPYAYAITTVDTYGIEGIKSQPVYVTPVGGQEWE